MKRPLVDLAWMWVAIAVPSSPIVLRYTGLAGLLAYCVLVALALVAAPSLLARVRSLGQGAAVALSMSLIAAMVLLFAIGYPRANVQVPGQGSDDDDGHDVGVAALLAGESPYARLTYLGNPLHQLPGSYVIAAPFAIAGGSALQNLVCLPLFFMLAGGLVRERRLALALACLVALSSVAVPYQIVTGSSYSWNAIWVLLGMWLVIRRPRNTWAAAFCGVAMCSRPNFLLLMLPMAGLLARRDGVAVMVRALGVIAGTAALLVAPFAIDPAPFTPLDGFGRLEQLDDVMMGTGVAILLMTAMVAIAAMRIVKDEQGLFLASGIVQLTPVAAGMLIGLLIDPRTALSFAPYASFGAWFLLLAAAPNLPAWRR
jgi:hypothetical protein